jgi:nicotinamidase-related amidase
MSDHYTEPDFATAALITIDTQCDVLDGGALEVAGTSAVLHRIVSLAGAFRAANRPIVHLVRLYERDGGNVDLCRRESVENGAMILTPGTPGSQLAPDLPPAPARELEHEALLAGRSQPLAAREVVIYKPRWGAFYGTSLERHLRDSDITTIVFCGCNFPNCPRTSIYEASERDFRVVLVRDAVSQLYERGEHELRNIGVRVMDTDDLLHALRQTVAGPLAVTP